MGEEVLEEWGVGEFLVQKCEIGIGGIHYHVFSDTLNGKQIADRLEKYIEKLAKERGWKRYDHVFSVDWKDNKKLRSQVGIYVPKRGGFPPVGYRLHINIFDREFKEQDLNDILLELTKERDKHRKTKLAV